MEKPGPNLEAFMKWLLSQVIKQHRIYYTTCEMQRDGANYVVLEYLPNGVSRILCSGWLN